MVPWYQMLQKEGAIDTWDKLVKAREEAYGPSIYESPEHELFNLTKQDLMSRYYSSSTALANRCRRCSPLSSVGLFYL